MTCGRVRLYVIERQKDEGRNQLAPKFEWLYREAMKYHAGIAMAISSVTVVGNSILRERYKPRFVGKKQKEGEIYDSDDLKKSILVTTNFRVVR